MTEIDPSRSETERMQAGVRVRVRALARRGGGRALNLTPSVLVSLLCVGALGPVVAAAAAVTGGVALAGIGVVASVGGNILADVVTQAIDRLRVRLGDDPAPSGEVVEEELAGAIDRVLAAGDAHAEELRGEIARLLAAIDADGTALQAAVEARDLALSRQIMDAFMVLRAEFAEFGFLLTGISGQIGGIQQLLEHDSADKRAAQRDQQQLFTEVRLMLEQVTTLTRRAPGPGTGDADADRRARWADECPFQGLAPFQERHAEVFYGRDRLTARLVGVVADRMTGPGMLVVTGASGAGKSSLLEAGLMPALARGVQLRGSGTWRRVFLTPTRRPLDELAVHLARLTGTDPGLLYRSLADHPEQAHLLVRNPIDQATGSSSDPAARVIVVVDQFEELFTLDDAATAGTADREAFLTALHAIATTPTGAQDRPAAVVVLAVRGDFIDQCAAHPHLANALADGPFVVTPMTEPELRQAIAGPIDTAGLRIEPGLVDTILADLRSETDSGYAAGSLPLLSQALMLTWQNREAARLTIRGYARTGGVHGAVQQSADTIYDTLPPEGRRIAQNLFRRLTVVTGDGRLTRRRLPRTDLHTPEAPGVIDNVLDAFAAQRLLVLNDASVEIAHDVLLQAWPRLRNWLDDDHTASLLFSRLLDDSREWDDQNRDRSFHYRGNQLAAIREALTRWDDHPDRYPQLSESQRNFVEASVRAAIWRRIGISTPIVVFVVAVVAVAGIAILSARAADQARKIAVSRQLATDSALLVDSDPVTASLLAAAAWREAHTPEARYSLLNALSNPERGFFVDSTGNDHSVVFSPDGRTLASFGADGAIRLWDLATHHQIGAPLTSSATFLHSVVFSPDGRTLASAGDDRSIRLWDVGTHHQIGAPFTSTTGPTGVALSVGFSPDGRTLASAGDDGLIRLWDVGTHHQIGAPFTSTTSHTSLVVFNPDGRTLASAGGDGLIRLWDVGTHHQVGTPINGPSGVVSSVGFSPDGRTLASAGGDGLIRLWDVGTHHQVGTPINGPSGVVSSVVFSPDGRTLASPGDDGSIWLWDVGTHHQLSALFTGSAAPLNSVGFSPDGRTLASLSADGAIRLWDLAIYRQVGVPLTVPTGPVSSVGFSPDGRTLASAGEDHTVRLWDVGTHHQVGAPITSPTGPVSSVGFSPDGRTLASAGDDGSIRLWDVATHRQVGVPFPRPPGLTNGLHFIAGSSIVFSPDGRTLASAGEADTIRLWDVGTHRQIGAPITGPSSVVSSVVFSPDGRTLASAGDDGAIRLWDVGTHRQIGTPLTGHTGVVSHRGVVSSVVFSPDGRTLASAGDDGSIRLWDVATHRQIGTPLTGHTGTVSSVVFSPDGRTLASAGGDDTIRLWDVAAPADPFAAVCADVGRTLTRTVWNEYAPREAFRQPCP